MALKIIGAGFGRTGTTSVKIALEKLGFTPCYHMFELIDHPEHVPHWQTENSGKQIRWDNLFSKFKASLDWPACAFWEDLHAEYPSAKILLTVRDPGSWYESFKATLFPAMNAPKHPNSSLAKLAKKIVLEDTFHNRFLDRAYAIKIFEMHIEKVKQIAPANQLLVYDVKQGWEPLCEFLNLPVPDGGFPRKNTRENVIRRK